MIKHIREWDSETLERFKGDINKELELRKRKRYDDLYNAFDVIVENNLKNRIPYDGINSNVHYLRECCTVRLDPGRQQGKTQYIIERMNPKKDVVICAKNSHVKYFKDRYRDRFKMDRSTLGLPLLAVADISYLRTMVSKITDTKVWIDEVERDEDLNIIYSFLSRYNFKDSIIIHMGH